MAVSKIAAHTHTHTHTYIYIYIYFLRVKEDIKVRRLEAEERHRQLQRTTEEQQRSRMVELERATVRHQMEVNPWGIRFLSQRRASSGGAIHAATG